MARIDGRIEGDEEVEIDLDALLRALAEGRTNAGSRHEAIAHFLSAGDGWRDAATRLGGRFADGLATGAGLTGGQDE